ncbi:hypothetical protein [Mediterraneibacter faecis]|uniref:hypothetical protein n=1 Tax=Mediterraneibacter faecis TaxID=592978 RepID=UPI001C034CFC|nr:hypothetical protein [Mediterraneibacter faecis]MBT9618209.1 hypothetical protein [Mediterraneibacter faecis]
MHFDGKMKNNRRKIERGLGILPYGNSTTQTIGKCGGFRLCHDTGSASGAGLCGVGSITLSGKVVFDLFDISERG